MGGLIVASAFEWLSSFMLSPPNDLIKLRVLGAIPFVWIGWWARGFCRQISWPTHRRSDSADAGRVRQASTPDRAIDRVQLAARSDFTRAAAEVSSRDNPYIDGPILSDHVARFDVEPSSQASRPKNAGMRKPNALFPTPSPP